MGWQTCRKPVPEGERLWSWPAPQMCIRDSSTDIQVDGGISAANVRDVLDAGANVIVAGSAVFKNDAAANTREFLEIFSRYQGR